MPEPRNPVEGSAAMREPGRVDVVPLFPPLHEELVRLLSGLSASDWERPTVAGAWRVRDIAAHLLDTDLRRISAQRDGWVLPVETPVTGWADLVKLLNGLNAGWVQAARRLSPRVLVELLTTSGRELAAVVATLDPDAPAPFSVLWAGQSTSTNRFDLGREYTEKWHHQAQIRLAVGAPPLDGRRFLHPVLALSMHALPRALEGEAAPEGTAVSVSVTGDAGGAWSAVRGADGWRLFEGEAASPAARVAMDAETAWRLLYNALSADDARARVSTEGDGRLAAAVLRARSVMV
ncbi:MAG: maleylpyruvate isomerase N-terminal domain-containing protein [Thermoanaerobaculia bacterium]